MDTMGLDHERLQRLLAAGRTLVAQLDVEAVLAELLDAARDITEARYAALGVLDEDRTELERFLTRGISPEAHRVIGDLPRGRGVLGVLIDEPRPLRLDHVGADPRSYGFPPGHPQMGSFLGVPLMIRGEAWGNLYLTGKIGAERFDESDQAAALLLADWAAIAIDNARLYRDVEARRDALERAVLSLEATSAIARAVGGETDLDRVLRLIVRRGRALVEARALTIALLEGSGLVIAAGAGDVDPHALGTPVAMDTGPVWSALQRRSPERIADLPERLGAPGPLLGVSDARTALLAPLVFRGRPVGVLCAFDRQPGSRPFHDEHEQLLLAFAANAATAVATIRTVAQDRLRDSLRAAEEERRRWARELHDETLQSLAGVRVLLAGALRRSDAAELRSVASEAVDQLQGDIDGLRALITDLRPAALDELGLAPALHALTERVAARHGVEITTALQPDAARAVQRLSADTETALYRIAQEALANAARHSGAAVIALELEERDGRLALCVRDQGSGFDPAVAVGGFGLVGIRERVELAGGRLELESSSSGTTLRVDVPAAEDY